MALRLGLTIDKNEALNTSLIDYASTVGNDALFKNENCIQCALWEMEDKDHWSEKQYLIKLYLETVKTAVTGYSIITEGYSPTLDKLSAIPYSDGQRFAGRDWPRFGYTMVGVNRLNIIQIMLEHVIMNNIPGDFMECGVWRGGASIFARAVIVAYGSKKKVILADSFAGLPKGKIPEDKGVEYFKQNYLAVDEELVKNHIRRFGLGTVQKSRDRL